MFVLLVNLKFLYSVQVEYVYFLYSDTVTALKYAKAITFLS